MQAAPAGGDHRADGAARARTAFRTQGTINFVNNQVNPTTGSISVRGVFPNPKPADGRSAAVAGDVRADPPADRPAAPGRCWSIDRAVGSDQGLKYVYVVDAENTVQYRRVTTGPLQDDGLRVIDDGLKPDEWVVVGGLQQVRPRMVVAARADADADARTARRERDGRGRRRRRRPRQHAGPPRPTNAAEGRHGA